MYLSTRRLLITFLAFTGIVLAGYADEPGKHARGFSCLSFFRNIVAHFTDPEKKRARTERYYYEGARLPVVINEPSGIRDARNRLDQVDDDLWDKTITPDSFHEMGFLQILDQHGNVIHENHFTGSGYEKVKLADGRVGWRAVTNDAVPIILHALEQVAKEGKAGEVKTVRFRHTHPPFGEDVHQRPSNFSADDIRSSFTIKAFMEGFGMDRADLDMQLIYPLFEEAAGKKNYVLPANFREGKDYATSSHNLKVLAQHRKELGI